MRCRPWRAAWALSLLGLVTVTLETAAPGKSPGSRLQILQQRRDQTAAKRQQVEAKLREVRAKQRLALSDYYDSERKLSAAEQQLRRAKVQSEAAETRRQQTEAQLNDVNAKLDQHVAAMWKRLEVFYKEGTSGYVEVALGATDFQDFVDRAVFMRSLADNDIQLKQKIQVEQQQVVALRNEREQTVRELESLKRQVAEQTEVLHQQTARKHDFLAQVQHDRALQEQAYDEVTSAQRDIEQTLYSLQHPAPHISPSPGGGPVDGGGGGGGGRLSGGFIKPCAGRITDSFGWRIHPILHTRRFHDGSDIAAPYGTTIVAAASGTVIKAGWTGAYGNTLMINHGGGYVTMYGHCSQLLASVGQQVRQGQPVARVGSTGWSTGPHCHFSIYRNGVAINPLGQL